MTNAEIIHPNPRAFSTIGIVLALFCLIIAGLLLMKASSMDAAAYSSACTLQTTAGSGLLTKNIEDVKAGDKVWAYDAVNNQWKVEPVIRPLVHDYVGDMVSISVAGQTITSTGNHPYWVAGGGGLFDREQAKDVYPSDRTSAVATGKGRWIEARKLQAGDMLVLRDGSRCPISEVQVSYAKQKVYNLQVADLHTYAVSDVGVAVHNKPCFPPGTLILMGDGSVKPIEQVELGDQVMAGDPTSRGPPHAASITGIIRDFTDCLVDVTFRGPTGHLSTIASTPHHPFWTNDRGWVTAQDLRPVEVLQDARRNNVAIVKVSLRHRLIRCFNLEVANVHTYYAESDDRTPVLVHNQVMPYKPVLPGNEIAPYFPSNNGFGGETGWDNLASGDSVWRYGGPNGKFVTTPGTPPYELSLPPGSSTTPTIYQVAPDCKIPVQTGKAAAAFGQPGMGDQMMFGYDKSLQDLLDEGKLIKVNSGI